MSEKTYTVIALVDRDKVGSSGSLTLREIREMLECENPGCTNCADEILVNTLIREGEATLISRDEYGVQVFVAYENR